MSRITSSQLTPVVVEVARRNGRSLSIGHSPPSAHSGRAHPESIGAPAPEVLSHRLLQLGNSRRQLVDGGSKPLLSRLRQLAELATEGGSHQFDEALQRVRQ